jgi:hypothetical protein
MQRALYGLAGSLTISGHRSLPKVENRFALESIRKPFAMR